LSASMPSAPAVTGNRLIPRGKLETLRRQRDTIDEDSE
jgi:hypothetical protein